MDLLFSIWFKSSRVVDLAEDALREPLTTGDDRGDDADARFMLTKAMAAAKQLRDHLEASFELKNGQAEAKVTSCQG